MRREDLRTIDKFIVVIGEIEGKRQACITRQRREVCYELYPKYFTLNSCVGSTGTTNLIEFYRFMREADRIKKLDDNAYFANEEQMSQLMSGEIYPKMVEKFKLASCFIDDFMCISESDIDRNKKNGMRSLFLYNKKLLQILRIMTELIKRMILNLLRKIWEKILAIKRKELVGIKKIDDSGKAKEKMNKIMRR